MSEINKAIKDIDKVICDNIESLYNNDRGLLSQNILSQLRNFLEHIFLKFYIDNIRKELDINYENLQNAKNYIYINEGKYRVFKKFHKLLQISASHYTLDKESSERLMLKYLVYLYKIKKIFNDNYNLSILDNIEKFPTDINSSNREYYKNIIGKINKKGDKKIDYELSKERYYIQKIKPFFISSEIYYEVTFTRADDIISKFDRIIAFTKLDILHNYAVKLKIRKDSIDLLGKELPINVIESWEISIRPCEFDNFIKIFGENKKIGGNKEIIELMSFLTKYNLNLVDIINLTEEKYNEVKNLIIKDLKVSHFFNILDSVYEITKNNKPGTNVLKYLLFTLNNRITKLQYSYESCDKLSNLYLNWGVIPFDNMPFCSGLIEHNPKSLDLFDCLNISNRDHEFLARFINNNIEQKGELFTKIENTEEKADMESLVKIYNSNLYLPKHGNRLIEKFHNNLYLKGYVENTISIIKELQKLSSSGGLKGYSNSIISWLEKDNNKDKIDDDSKKDLLIKMFENSSVSFIYGAAGTGKTTMINLISSFFEKKGKILFLANTHPAVDNLKRRVNEANDSNCKTIKKFIYSKNIDAEYDLLIIDECSTVSNEDMVKILQKASYKLLVLVGDVYQIEAIKFGNWFDITRNFISTQSIFELINIHRTKNTKLLDLWNRVRNLDDTMIEHISKNGYSISLDESIFNNFENNEIILCLNYDGLYGVNNINKFLQLNNKNEAIEWGVHIYKVGDPILFNELSNDRFSGVLYNNLKGTITNIIKNNDVIQFDIEIDTLLEESDLFFVSGIELLNQINDGKSVIRFNVKKYGSNDYENDDPATIIPFQIAYAVSIHKAQGLEYNSVKIVISDEVGEMITHNIFYTAITRAREKLKIYWTPETQNKILENFKKTDNNKDYNILKQLMEDKKIA